MYQLLKSLVKHPKRLKTFKNAVIKDYTLLIYDDKIGTCERERAIGMLKANVTPLIVAKRFRNHVRTIGRLKNRFQQFGTTSHRPRQGRRRVLTRRKDRDIQTSSSCNRFHLESVTARTSQGTHNPKIKAQTV